MNLEFGILWIENSFSDMEKEKLERRVKDAGFIANIKDIPNGEDIDDLAKEHNLFHIFDIILLDYKLDGVNGDDLAIKVRERFPSTTILFYSGSVGSEEKLRMMIAKKDVEGVYCCSRNRFIERAGELIDQTASALNRLSGMRGLAMQVVAECDDLMKSIMLTMCEKNPNCQKELSKLDDDVLEFLSKQKKEYESIISNSEGNLSKRLLNRAVDSSKLFNHFRRLIKIFPQNDPILNSNIDYFRTLRKDTAQYSNDVLKKRNILGHVVEKKGENGLFLEGDDNISIDDFLKIRQDFAKYRHCFREIKKILKGEQSN